MQTYFLNADTETTGFNGPMFSEDGKPLKTKDGYQLTGAMRHKILSFAAQLTDQDLNVIQTMDFLVYYPMNEIMSVITNDTLEFHKKVHPGAQYSFWDLYMAMHNEVSSLGHFNMGHLVVDVNGHMVPVTVFNGVEPLDQYVSGVIKQITGIERYIGYKDVEAIIELMGKSVDFDRSFIRTQMPHLDVLFCHQLMDTSFMKNCGRTWAGIERLVKTTSTHHALADCEAALEEAKVIRDFFKRLPQEKYIADALKQLK